LLIHVGQTQKKEVRLGQTKLNNMNPKERQEFEKMKKELADIRQARDVVFTESLRNRLLQEVINAGIQSNPTTAENTSTVVPSGGGTVLHAGQYDRRVLVELDGSSYYIGLYNV
jgi:hypothetical protein